MRLLSITLALLFLIIGQSVASDNTSVNLPRNLQIIESEAFFGNTSLNTVNLPNNVTHINDHAFAYSSLEYITLPNSLKYISENAFEGCHIQLASVFPGSYAENYCLANNIPCDSTSFITDSKYLVHQPIDNTCTAIIGYSGSASTLIIPETIDGYTVTRIDNSAFEGRSELQSVYLPDSITSIGAYSFSTCFSLQDINLPKSLDTIEDGAFAFCFNLTSIDFPSSLQNIGMSAFSCTGLTSIILPDSLTTINDYTFSACSAVTRIQFPSSLSHIGDSAFSGTNITEALLPDSVTHIGSFAFSNCAQLTDFHYPLNWAGSGEQGSILYGCHSLNKVTIPEGVTHLAPSAFSYIDHPIEIHFPSTLESIGDFAFYAFSGSDNILLPDSVKTIGAHSFSNCTTFTTFDFPASLESIGNCAFYGCTSLTSADLPDSVAHIGSGTFEGCSSLSYFNYPLNWTTASWMIFARCTSLSHISVPEGVTFIPDCAFQYASCLQSISLPSTLLSIGEYSFANCPNITSLILPDSVTHIGSYSFQISDGSLIDNQIPRKIYFPPSISSIDSFAFDGCNNTTIHCEYGTYALRYAMDKGIPYFYLSMTGAQYPSSTLYQGDLFNFYGYVRSSESISSITASIYSVAQDNNVMYASFEPKATESNLYQLLQPQFKIETLPCGEYTYSISATAGEETETFIASRFQIIPPPLRISTDMITVPLGSISQGSLQALEGIISSNYIISTAEIYIYNVNTEEFIQSCLLYPNSYSFNISAASTINTALLDGGKYLFFIKITSNQESVIAYKNIFYISTPTQREARIRDFDKVFESSSISGGNKALCIESVNISNAAYSKSSVKNNLEDLGFKNIEFNRYSSGADTIGHSIGWKDIVDKNGNTARLLAVVCRGTNSADEWLSNFSFTLTDEGFHGGFYRASQDVLISLNSYINKNFPGTHPSDYKIWITGHSRGGAVANILAGYLLPNISCNDNNIYAYTFACPSVSISSLPTKQNIRNFNLGGDLVPRLPMKSWGFNRYGWSVTYPNKANEIDEGLISMENMDRIEGMLYELTGDRYVEITQRLYDTLTGHNNTNLVDFVFAFIDAAYFVQSKHSLAIPNITKPDEICSSKQFYEGLISLGFNAGSIGQTHSCSSYVKWIENRM